MLHSTGSSAILLVYMSLCFSKEKVLQLPSEYGVPQVSVLGPLLFVLYRSDVPRIIDKCGLLSIVYADDTQINIPYEAARHSGS